MDKGIQNSVFFQNAANFPNFEYDVQRIYQQLARPVLCPIMAIPQDMLCNFQGLGNLPPCVNSREKVLKSSVQKVFISSTSCFQSYKPQRKNRVSSINLKKDAAVLTSKQNIENITQKRDIGTPTSRLDTPSRNVQYLYKKRCGDSLIDAEYEDDYEEYNNTIDRDMRLKQLLKNLLAARRREKQIARYSRLKKLQKYRSQNDPDLSSDENYEISNDKKSLKEINAYYVNCDSNFANPRKRTGNNVKKTLQKSFPSKQYTRNKHPLCYPMSSQGRKMMIQKEREGHQKKVQAPETTTCDSTCECHDFNYYNNKIRSIIAKYGESFECDKICSSANHSKTNEKKSNFSTYESFMQDKMDKAKYSMKNLQNPYSTCGCFQNDSNTEASSATATTDEQQEVNQRNMNNQHGRRESVLDSKLQCDESIKDNLGSKPEQHDVSTQDGYFQNICDGVKSDSFPYLCSCFKKKKVNDKAILARNCCNNIVKSHAAQTESAVRSVDDSVQTQSIKDTNVQKKDVGYSWILNDNPNFQFKEAPKTAKDIEKESNPKVKHACLNTESSNNRLEPTSPKAGTDIKENTNLKVKNAGLGTTDDTIKEIHKEKLQAIFEKYIDDKMPLTKYTLPNIFGDNEGIINNNFQKHCESICEQIHQQKREMWQLSNQGKEPSEFLLNIMERLDELTKLINSYVKETNDLNCCTLRQSSAQKPRIKSNYWNFSMQQSNRLQKLDADTNSSAIAMKHAETQLDSTQKIILQNETSKIKQMKKDVEEIVNDIIKKVNVVSSGLGDKTQSLKTDNGFIPKCLEKPIKYNQAATSSQRKMTIAVNTDQLGLVSLLKMSTEALMRLLSYFPMVSSNPVFGTAYKQSVSHYVCNVCGAIFQKSSQLSDHIEEKHNLDQIRDCCICRHTLELQQQPVTGLYTCQYCGRHFTRAYCCDLHQKGCAKRHGVTPEVHSSLALLR